MKKILLIMLSLLSLTFISCEDNDEDINNPFTGKWEVIKSHVYVSFNEYSEQVYFNFNANNTITLLNGTENPLKDLLPLTDYNYYSYTLQGDRRIKISEGNSNKVQYFDYQFKGKDTLILGYTNEVNNRFNYCLQLVRK